MHMTITPPSKAENSFPKNTKCFSRDLGARAVLNSQHRETSTAFLFALLMSLSLLGFGRKVDAAILSADLEDQRPLQASEHEAVEHVCEQFRSEGLRTF